MFTGIVDHCGQIAKIEPYENHCCLTIASHFNDLVLGESIAIDGACLTVTEHNNSQFTVQLSPETMRLTTASHYQVGTSLNLERSLRLSDRLGGHFVTGHVDGLCEIKAIICQQEFTEIQFHKVLAEHKNLLVKKGSVAINGVSLTINEVTTDGFAVMLIPHTLEITNLSGLKVGHQVNVEYDYLAKLIQNQINRDAYEKQ